MTFKEYIAIRRITDTPAGDFTRDAQRDSSMPDVTTWNELRFYVERKADFSIRKAVIKAARQVWQGYLLATRKTKPNT